jgi:hypothetical protein
MGASHSVAATDTKAEDIVTTIVEPEIDPEENELEELINEMEMNWFWPFI